MLGVTQSFGKFGGSRVGGGGYECQNLSSCGLATLKQPPGRCGDAEGAQGFLRRYKESRFVHPPCL